VTSRYRTVGRDWLLLLAVHLEHGKLWHDVFYFDAIHYVVVAPTGKCSVGCAVGEMPALSSEWNWNSKGVVWDGATKPAGFEIYSCITRDTAEFFGIPPLLAKDLFMPSRDRQWADGMLSYYVTRYDVARSIRDFVSWFDRNPEYLSRSVSTRETV